MLFSLPLLSLSGFIVGTCLGSFALALAERSLSNRTFWGRSSCPHCKHVLAFFDLIPVWSYLTLRGKCRYCQKKIGIEYLIIELAMGLTLALIFAAAFPSSLNVINVAQFFLKIFMVTVLMIVAITDYKKTLIPDRITYPAIVIVFLALVLISVYQIWQLYQSLYGNPIGNFLLFKTDYFWRHAIIMATPLWSGLIMAFLIGLTFLILILVTRGRGMGGGDLKLGFLMGLFFAFPQALAAIMLAFFLGSIFAIGLILVGKKKFGQTIPFGPFLSLGALLTLLWGEQIMNWYLNLKLM